MRRGTDNVMATLAGEFKRLWKSGTPEALADRRKVGNAMYDVLKGIGGEWSMGGDTWILTPDAECMAAAGAKWAGVAKFAADASWTTGYMLADYRAARRQAADAKGVA